MINKEQRLVFDTAMWGDNGIYVPYKFDVNQFRKTIKASRSFKSDCEDCPYLSRCARSKYYFYPKYKCQERKNLNRLFLLLGIIFLASIAFCHYGN